MGESGAGKDAVVDKVVKTYGASRLDSYTTRPRRNLLDRHYFVDSYEDWLKRNRDDEVVGYTNFNGYQYWASQKQVDNSDLYIIDPDGVLWFKDHYNGVKQCKVVYIDVPAKERLRRMLRRGDGLVAALKRLWYDRHKFDGGRAMADMVIRNYAVKDCADDLWRYMNLVDGI